MNEITWRITFDNGLLGISGSVERDDVLYQCRRVLACLDHFGEKADWALLTTMDWIENKILLALR